MRRDERGAAPVEFALLVPVLVLIIGLIIGAGRLALARMAAQQWADSAARSASIARDAVTARDQALAVVSSDAAASGVRCLGGPSATVDVAAFSLPVGQAGTVGVRVACTVPMGDLLVPGIPGSFLVEGGATSTLDRYRGRR